MGDALVQGNVLRPSHQQAKGDSLRIAIGELRIIGQVSDAQAQGWQPDTPAAPAHDAKRSIDGLRSLLTERQIDVMRLLSQGKPNKLIARDLGISEGTVKIHLAAIFRALNVRNRVEAVVASRKLQGL